MFGSDCLDDLQTASSSAGGGSAAGVPADLDRRVRSILETYFARGAMRKVARGQLLWSEGDECHYVYQVRSGSILLSHLLPDGRRAVHDFAFQGDVIGLGAATHGRDAEAIEPTSLYALPMPLLLRAMRDDPAFMDAIRAQMRWILRSTREHLTVVSRLAAGERIAHFLIELSEQSRRCGSNPLRLRIPMRRVDVADYLGLTVETVCRTLTSFRNAGVIRMQHAGEVWISDMPRLGALAKGDSDPADPMRRAS
jgi:CRP/FNR family transcriptional regulator